MLIAPPQLGFYLHIGRSYWTDRDCEIELGCLARHDPKPGVYAHRFIAHVSWNWRPIILYRLIIESGAYNSARRASSVTWTGRDREMIGWRWPISAWVQLWK